MESSASRCLPKYSSIQLTSHVDTSTLVSTSTKVAKKDIIPACSHSFLGRRVATSSRPSIPRKDAVEVRGTVKGAPRILLVGDCGDFSSCSCFDWGPIEIITNEGADERTTIIHHLCWMIYI